MVRWSHRASAVSVWVCLVALAASPPHTQGQQDRELLAPEPLLFDSPLEFLDFSNPTTIEGLIRFVDVSERAIWLQWDRRLEDHPSGEKVWRTLGGEFMLLVYPRDGVQFDTLKELAPGTRLRMVIQSNDTGRRSILSYADPSVPPEVPL
jgi:hypothetical protein